MFNTSYKDSAFADSGGTFKMEEKKWPEAGGRQSFFVSSADMSRQSGWASALPARRGTQW